MRTYFQAGLRTNSSDPRIAFGKINLIQMEYPGRLVRRSITSLARLRPPTQRKYRPPNELEHTKRVETTEGHISQVFIQCTESD